MNTVDKLLSVARDQIGYLEKRSPADEDSKTGNSGYNNYNKYARDLRNEIGAPFADGYAWCCSFLEWCFVRAFGQSEALKLLGIWTAYCPTLVNKFKNMGRWHTSNPKQGDVIFFYDSTGDYGHVGIVESVDSSTVYTIEGNTSSSSGVVPNGGGVFRKSYSIGYSRIAGYGRPDYDVVKREPYKKKMPVLTAKRPVLKKGMKNLQVQRLQKFLNWYFYNRVVNNMSLATDKDFGEMTRQGVIRFQKDVFPGDSSQWDGEFGAKSLAKAKEFTK